MQNIVDHFQEKARKFLDLLGEGCEGYNGDWALTDLKRPLLNVLKDTENLNTAFYNNVPGGDDVYFVKEVANELKKKLALPLNSAFIK